MTIVKCDEIKKYFTTGFGIVKAVDGVSLEIEKGEAFGLIGESGCGKTTLGKIILGILKPDSGRVEIAARNVQVIFQDPYNSLDPRMRVRDIVAEGVLIKGQGAWVKGQGEIKRRVEEMMDLVKMPKDALNKYPHQFSGGERQRIAIGRALLTDPDFIVCDEPVSSLDVMIQLEILTLLNDIRKRFNISYLFISHDLKVVRFICSKVAVMKDGRILEAGLLSDIYQKAAHPYTKALLTCAFYDNIENDARDSL